MAIGFLKFYKVAPGFLKFEDENASTVYAPPLLTETVVLFSPYTPPPLAFTVVLGANDSLFAVTESTAIDFVGVFIQPRFVSLNLVTADSFGNFAAIHASASGNFLVTTANITSIFTAVIINPITGFLATTTANVTSIFSTYSTITGTFDTNLVFIFSNITLKFTWFFTTIDIQLGQSLISFIRIALNTSVTINSSNLLLNHGNFIGTVPLRYFVTIFSYLDTVRCSFVGRVYPTGNIANSSLTVNSVNILGKVPIAIQATLFSTQLVCSFLSTGVSLIGINLVPVTNTLQTQLFVRVDLPKNITFTPIFYCSVSMYGYTKNHGSLDKVLSSNLSNIAGLVPTFIQCSFDVLLNNIVPTPWIGRVSSAGNLESTLFSVSTILRLRCFIGGSLTSNLNTFSTLFTLIRKDQNTGTLSSSLTLFSNIYIQGNHYIPNFNPIITNTISGNFVGLNTKIGVTIDIKNTTHPVQNSFTGPFFQAISFNQASLAVTLQNTTSFIQGAVSIQGVLFQQLPVFSNIVLLIPIVSNTSLFLSDFSTNFTLFYGIESIDGYFYQTTQDTELTINFRNYYVGRLQSTTLALQNAQISAYTKLTGSLLLRNLNFTTLLTLERLPYYREGYLILNTANATSALLGFGGKTEGSLNLITQNGIFVSQGSHTFFKLELNNLLFSSNLNLVSLVAGNLFKELPLEISSDIKGGVPIAISVVFDVITPSAFIQLNGRIATRVIIDTNKFSVLCSFFGSITTGFFDTSLSKLTSTIYLKREERQTINVAWITEAISTEFKLQIETQGSLVGNVSFLSLLKIGIVPLKYFGSFVSIIESTINSQIRLLNLKNVYLDHWEIVTVPINVYIYGSVQIAGVLNNSSLTITSYILAKTPLLVTAALTSELWSPQLTSTGYIPVYGQFNTFTQNDFVTIHGTHNIGSFYIRTDNFKWSLSGITVIKINIIIDMKTKEEMSCIFYGYLLLYRGVFNVNTQQSLSVEFKAHTPIVNNRVYFGSFLKTLATISTDILVRLELVHGVLENILTTSAEFLGWSTLTANFNVSDGKLLTSVDFIGISDSIVGRVDVNTGLTETNKVSLFVEFVGFSKLVIKMILVTEVFNCKLFLKAIPVFRGYVNIHQYNKQGVVYDTLPTPVSIARGIVPDFIYGRFESSIPVLTRSDINIRGIAALKIFGIFETTLNEITVTSLGFFPFYLTLDSTLRSLVWHSLNTNFVARMHLETNDLNVLKNKIIGVAVIAIDGVLNGRLNDDLQSFVRVRVLIYGALKNNLNSATSYFRTNSNILGYIIGGDREPCDPPYPCFDVNLLPPGVPHFNVPKQYWTLEYATSSIYLKYSPTIYGFMYGTLNEHVAFYFNYKIVELNKTITLKFYGTDSNLRTSFNGLVPIKGTLICTEDEGKLYSFNEYGTCVIFGSVPLPIVGSFDATILDIRSVISLFFVITIARFNKDLPLVACEFFGIIAVIGRVTKSLDSIFTNINAIIPVAVSVTVNGKLDNIQLDLELYTPFQIFGRFRNYYLSNTACEFEARTLIFGGSDLLSGDVETYFNVEILSFVGVFNVKLLRIFPRIFVTVEPPTYMFYGNFNNILQNFNNSFVTVVSLFGRTAEIKLQNCTSAILGLTPIRIYASISIKLLVTSIELKGTSLLIGSLENTLMPCTADFTLSFIKPVQLSLTITLETLTVIFLTRAFPTGSLTSFLSFISIDNVGCVGNSYGYFLSYLEELVCVSELWTAEKSVAIPCEKLHNLSGDITAKNTKNAHQVNLYDADSGEFMQRITTATTPHSYSFNKAECGRFVVLATPLSGSFQSKVREILVGVV